MSEDSGIREDREEKSGSRASYQPARGCEASDREFVYHALLRLQGRGAKGVTELDVLTHAIGQLDARGLDGRRVVARSLMHTGAAPDPRFLRHAHTIVENLLELPRVGTQAMPPCHATRFPAAHDASLAEFVGTTDPLVSYGQPWGLGDLIESSLRLDDVRPILLGRLLTRVAASVDGNNVSAQDLETARRTNFGRAFEGVYLGRHSECLSCHAASYSVTDHPDPAQDKFWPLSDFAGPVMGAHTDAELYAGFRFEGFADGSIAPWGADLCGGFTPGYDGDILQIPGFLAGPLPPGATALDIVARLRTGFVELDPSHLTDEAAFSPQAALAGLVATHFADGLWETMSGHRLTLAHGYPRNREQRDALAHLTTVFVDSGYSLQALATEVVVHPALNQAPAGGCINTLSEVHDPQAPLPPLLDPYTPSTDPLHTGNGIGDGIVRLHAYTLLDRVSEAMGWPSAKRHPFPYTWEDQDLYQALGAHLEAILPGHREPDWIAALAWEDRLADGRDPGFAGQLIDDNGDTVERLLDLADTMKLVTIADLLHSLRDRVLQDPTISDEEGVLLADLTGLDLDAAVTSLPRESVDRGLRRAVGAWVATPPFMLAGLAPGPAPPPKLLLPDATPEHLCEVYRERLHAQLPAEVRFTCNAGQLSLPSDSNVDPSLP